MGQIFSKMPETWVALLEEKERVLHWSSEVLIRVRDNIVNENIFLMDYNEAKIDAKINTWMDAHQKRIEDVFKKFPNVSEQLKNELIEELQSKIRKEYQDAYSDIKKFNKKMDQLGEEERIIHTDIQKLEEECAGDVQKFQKKFGPLRTKVFNNLRIGEKMMFQEKKLKTDFIKKVYDIDHKYSADFTKRIEKLLKNFEKNAIKENRT